MTLTSDDYEKRKKQLGYKGCRNCKNQIEPLRMCEWAEQGGDGKIHLFCPRWDKKENEEKKMKIVIDIPDNIYDAIKSAQTIVSGQRSGKTLLQILVSSVENGTPFDSVMTGEHRMIDEETNLTSEELFALDIEQNVKDIDSGEDDSYYRGRLAGMLSAYRILNGKPYEEEEE